MWHARNEQLDGGKTLQFRLEDDQSTLKFADAVRLLREDDAFRIYLTHLLSDAPFSAFRWETPPVTSATRDRAFEFVLVEIPELLTSPDPSAFAEHFPTSPDQAIVVFSNLGKDATLVVPCPIDSSSDFGHLASFLRSAPNSQIHSLWTSVGDAMEKQIGRSPIWLSTAGAGVPWLHVRLDKRPKYYRHLPYRQ